jgi:Na+/pantothenate symporter
VIYCKQSFLDASNSTFLICKGTLSLHANILFEMFSLNNFKVLDIMPQLTTAERTFIVENYFVTKSIQEVLRLFRIAFPDHSMTESTRPKFDDRLA